LIIRSCLADVANPVVSIATDGYIKTATYAPCVLAV
jgi:hypothetical protein